MGTCSDQFCQPVQGTNEESQIQRGKVTCLGSHNYRCTVRIDFKCLPLHFNTYTSLLKSKLNGTLYGELTSTTNIFQISIPNKFHTYEKDVFYSLLEFKCFFVVVIESRVKKKFLLIHQYMWHDILSWSHSWYKSSI